MSFLTLNGIAAPALVEGSKKTTIEIADRGTAFSGAPYVSLRRRKNLYSVRLGPLSQSDADAWAGLVAGDGHHWTFDADLYADDGLTYSTLANAAVSSTHTKFGAKSLKLTATTGTITFPTALVEPWTVMVWQYKVAWHWVVVRSDVAGGWTDGVYNAGTSTSWLSVAGSTVLSEPIGLDTWYDDLIILPYLVPASWIASLYSAAVVWPTGLVATGDMISNGPRSVLGKVNDRNQEQLVLAGSWADNAERLDIDLEEV
jgi:hypothetical protein